MTINQKLIALGFDPSEHDAAVHSALDELAEHIGLDPSRGYAPRPMPDVKAWWEHVKGCDACTLARPRCKEGYPIYDAARIQSLPTRRGSVQVQHKDLIMRSSL
jgi:hypothetical protein